MRLILKECKESIKFARANVKLSEVI